ncbi:GNAT family N-acetyltransferase [Clostridium fallax]|uniref:Predicted N-acetyltransferase YhbS n=1 Tax=Clostridium fallax TaxID=1533 RepID=A0A1M4U8I7_9CLOT|nr:GNAT family N-acetyltransferase [Clostridium fallax]SHE53035.1 Predicted N-acetyltransferase YhbS [Clostridium fallax]SQB06133.1 acetyltransferase [Clostridium fallax]
MEFRSCCNKEDREKAIKLINRTFRGSRNLKETMDKEFPLLLGENNLSNMFIAIDNGKVVGSISMYKSNILIEGINLPVASIGSVCTDENYRKRGIASKLLILSEIKCLEENIPVQIISGILPIYKEYGADKVGSIYHGELENLKSNIKYKIIDFKEELLCEAIKLYNKESLRHYRTKDEFKDLLKGSLVPWGNNEFEFVFIEKDGILKGYLYLQIIRKEGKIIIREFVGDREDIVNSLGNIMEKFKLNKIEFNISYRDSILDILKLKNINLDKRTQHQSIKTIDFKNLISNLTPYFMQYMKKEQIDKFTIEEEEKGYAVKYKNDVLVLEDNEQLNHLIFGDNTEIINKCDGELKTLLKNIFPIPIPCIEGINYQ